jgi:hypothetical protein
MNSGSPTSPSPPPRERISRHRLFHAVMIFLICGVAGACVHPAAVAGGDADASIAALRTELKGVSAALVQMRTDLTAGRDIQTNDPWTLRLLGAGLLLLGLSYPVGKLVWTTLGGDRLRYGVADAWPMSRRRTDGDERVATTRGETEFVAGPPARGGTPVELKARAASDEPVLSHHAPAAIMEHPD